MNHQSKIDQFIRSLSNAKTIGSDSLNIYEDAARSENLRHWLESFEDTPQSTIFIGEAPGVKGARITGIPFTSPDILNSSDDPWQNFGPDTRYEVPHPHDPHQREATATILWKHVNRHFADLPRPLTWNAYPFWPHDHHKNSNRHPSASEIEYGSRWLRDIIELFPNSLVVSVGNVADNALRSIGVEHEHLRHPSHGGANDFDDGLGHIRDILR